MTINTTCADASFEVMHMNAFPVVNLLAVVVAAIANFIIGAVWYAPPVFGNRWMNLLGKKRDELGSPAKGFIGAIVGALILSYVLAVLIGYAGAKTAVDGAIIGLWALVGFVLTVGSTEVLFGAKPIKLYLLNNGYQLVAFIVTGAIIGAFG